jgi:DNA-binding NarL/FixJ family response regulator
MDKIRVMVVDDHAVFRQGICALLARRKGIEIVGEAGDGKQALTQVAALRPDVVLMDIAMPVMNGLEATQAIRKSSPATRVLVLTQYESKEYIFSLLQAGAAGYVLKLAPVEELVEAIRTVHSQGAFLPPDLLQTVVDRMVESSAAEPEPRPVLTERETQIVRLIAEGLTGGEIAERLCISRKTVVTHRANIMEKLGVHNTAELIRQAIRQGIVST